jgi:hypothetical protein
MSDAEDRDSRVNALQDLLELRRPITQAAAAVDQLPWDSDAELVTLRRGDAIRLIEGCLRGKISQDDLRVWAETLEGRDDVGFELDFEDVLKQLLFEFSSPELFEPISPPMLQRWLRRLHQGSSSSEPADGPIA